VTIARTPYPRALEEFPAVRQSTLSDFDECGLESLFERRYRKSFSDAASGRGIIWHRAAAKMLREMAAQGEERLEVDVGLAIMLETLRQTDVPIEEMVTCPMKEIHDLLWMTKKFCSEKTWSIERLVSVEERLAATLYYPNPYGGQVERIFSGQLDALFAEGENLERGIVVDWKTGWWLPPPSEISEAGFFQQRSYALLGFRNHSPFTSITLYEFYPRYSQAREATLYRDQLDEIELTMSALVERFDRSVEEDTWHASPGNHCGHCPRPMACPIFPKARRRGAIRSAEEAELAVEQVLVGEKAIAQNKEALKAWAHVHGPVPVRDAKANRVYGHRVQKRTRRPTKEETANALALGQSPEDLYRDEIGTRFDIHIPKIELEPEPDLEELLRQSLELAEQRRRNG
jgi:hypothetical protein